MRRLISLAAFALALAVLAAACRQYLPSNRYLQLRQSPAETEKSTADALAKFNHAHHHAVFEKAGVTCLECHRFDLLIGSSNDEMARELSHSALYPGAVACHFCHKDAATRMPAAPHACTTCHGNLEAIKPLDHEVAWMKVHANAAAGDPQRCETCHRQSFCIDCHQRRDTIQTRVHDRNFLSVHSVEARANPMKCGSCHREDFCIRCHQQGNVELNP